MIAFLFLFILTVVMLLLAATGTVAMSGPIGGLALLSLVFLVFFCAGIYVAAALGVLGLLAGFVVSDRPLHLFIGEAIWIPSVNFVLVAVPLFTDVFVGVTPFVLVYMVGVIILMAFPDIALWLPRVVK